VAITCQSTYLPNIRFNVVLDIALKGEKFNSSGYLCNADISFDYEKTIKAAHRVRPSKSLDQVPPA